jgi:hypothetical protein
MWCVSMWLRWDSRDVIHMGRLHQSIKWRTVTWTCIVHASIISSPALDTSDWLSRHIISSFPDAPIALPSINVSTTGNNRHTVGPHNLPTSSTPLFSLLVAGGLQTQGNTLEISSCCSLWIDKVRAEEKTYIWVSVWWRTCGLKTKTEESPRKFTCLQVYLQ